jgi:hypothetical protein
VTVGAGLIVKSAGIVYGGMQSHCGTLTFSTATHSKRDVTCEIISLLCTIYTMPCARFIRAETCHTAFSNTTTVHTTSIRIGDTYKTAKQKAYGR